MRFSSDGTCVITIGGVDFPAIPYTQTETGLSCDYYGLAFDFEFTETGFEMLYGETMLLVYEAE